MAQHLIHVGYPKTGSTFLQAWFERHPELRYAPGGLGGFNNVYEVARPSGLTYKYYVTSFEGLSTPHASAGDVRLDFGGASPARYEPVKENQAAVCHVLKSLYPQSRVLIMTRGFRGMILSAYSQSVRMGARLHLGDIAANSRSACETTRGTTTTTTIWPGSTTGRSARRTSSSCPTSCCATTSRGFSPSLKRGSAWRTPGSNSGA
jgi:hypothetical protein